MAPPSGVALYCLLPSCKKLETLNEQFRRKRPKTPILTLNPLITGTCLLPSCKKLENLNNQFLINIKKIHLLTLNPWIKIFFSEFRPCHFFTLLTHNFVWYGIICRLHTKFQKKLMSFL